MLLFSTWLVGSSFLLTLHRPFKLPDFNEFHQTYQNWRNLHHYTHQGWRGPVLKKQQKENDIGEECDLPYLTQRNLHRMSSREEEYKGSLGNKDPLLVWKCFWKALNPFLSSRLSNMGLDSAGHYYFIQCCMGIGILTLSYFINITRIFFSLVIVSGLSTFWSLVNLFTAAQIQWNEGRSLAFSAQHSVRTENLKIAQF